MLKALELVGFKSFADKTRFEFSQGITAVVGPNGSGKSNVVDAIKWVLGEQSVKSLRGKEMVDVIFNGSGSRQALNAAETTLIIDNRQRVLALDTPEVQITRRVYRSGEGEYLINRQPSRLRDIRELFAGTGVSAEAYSIIEQGKVDIMLQSSPKDRRLIFEEAAGISRFKAKKVEALRRLERVEQNLLRLSDIVSEVESRLRSVRMQASKARRYKEHVDRLQQVRTQVGLADWQKLSVRLDDLEADLKSLGGDFAARTAEADAAEAECGQLDAVLAALDDSLRGSESQLAQNRQRIAGCEATINHETARGRDLEDEIARQRGQLNALGLRAGDLRHQLQHTLEMLATAEAAHAELDRRLASDDADLAAHVQSVDLLRTKAEQFRTEQVGLLRTITALDSTLATLESQVVAAASVRERAEKRLAELFETQTRLRDECQQLARRQAEQEQAVATHQAAIDAVQKRLADYRRQHAARTAELNQLRQRHSGASERAAVLAELESRLEGINAGAKEVLLAARRSPEGPYRAVRGLVADLFHVNMEMAPLVDLALGDKSQFLIVGEDAELIAFLEREAHRFKGRVGLLPMTPRAVVETAASPRLERTPGVVGRADQYVEAAPELAPLVGRLLGNTWIVEKLPLALQLHAQHGHGITLVTLAGELLAADGSLSIGPRQGAGSLISRRSELRVLRQLIAEIESTIGQVTVSLSQLEQQMASDEQQLAELVAQHQTAVELLASGRLRASEAKLRLGQCEERQFLLQTESAAAANQWEEAQRLSVEARGRHGDAGSRLAALEGQIATTNREVAELLAIQHELDRGVTATKIELAKSEERLENLTARHAQSERDQKERQRAIEDSRNLLSQCIERGQACQRQILTAESELAELYLDLEQGQAAAAELFGQREAHRAARAQRASAAQQLRLAARKLEERQHAVQLAAHEVRHERQTLADRLREDYAIELAELDAQQATDQELAERELVEQEIADLRRKVQNLGNVNLDALAELEELEARFAHLSDQHEDLTKAKNQLEQIIHRINADSRRLFSETLEIVKQNFEALFRKLFGGGQADIVLEEGVDILDSGIEIIARPPGKEPRNNISLLSGGEKTLTCVALLLAIFQYRPSPFCVLDEVDAALDEANIERFITVLQEFLAWTQFIVVTHSKKTMTCASTLYGVTMEESGVSKRVAVRFDDVSDSNEISPAAPEEGENAAGHKGDETQAA